MAGNTVRIPLIGVSDSGRSPDINSHRAINLMPQSGRGGSKTDFYWVATPGLVEFINTDEGTWPSRCHGLYAKSSVTIYGIFYQAPNYTLNTIAYNEPLGADLLTLTSFSQTAPTIWASTLAWVAFVQGSKVYCTPTSLAPSGTAAAVISKMSLELAVTEIVKTSGTTYTAEADTSSCATNDTVIFKGTTNFNNRLYTITGITDATHLTFTHVNSTTADETGLIDAYAYVQAATMDTLNFDSITSMDTYFIANTPIGVYVSYPDDARIWLPTNYFGASRDPDAIKRVYAYNGWVYVFGETTTEAYYNGGQGTQPFIPARPIAYDWGILGIQTLCELDDGLVWLANRKNGNQSVVMLTGGQITAISNKALEYQLNSSDSTQSTAYAFSYRDEYGEFYQLTFVVPGNTYATWCFDAETSSAAGVMAWHERQSASGGRHRARHYTYAPGLGGHIVSDYTSEEIYILTPSASTEFSGGATPSTVDRIGYSGHISVDGKGVVHHSIFIDMENPVGTGSVTLAWSDDGGNTYTSGVSKSFTGRGTRVEFFGLGFARYDRVYRITFTDVTVPINITGAYLNAEACKR